MNKLILLVRDTESSDWSIAAQTSNREKVDAMIENLRSDKTDMTPFILIDTSDYLQV